MSLLCALLLAAPVFDTFDGPLDPRRWYVGVGRPPSKGRVRIRRGGWIVSRGVADEGLDRIEIVFKGVLEVTFHSAREPLSSPHGEALVTPHGKGMRTLSITRDGATLDGRELPWSGTMRGTFRLRAAKGSVELDEVRVSPRAHGTPPPAGLEKRTVHFEGTPPLFTDAEGNTYARQTMILWDTEVSFLLRRGKSGVAMLQAPVRGAPVLGVLVVVGTGGDLAARAASNRLAMADWGDERRNLSAAEFRKYLHREFRLYDMLMLAQRALNAALPERKDLEALVCLACIRHTANAHSALGLAEVLGAKGALAAFRKAAGKQANYGRMSPDRIRSTAAAAARAILGGIPEQWPGFTFHPTRRFVTMDRARDLTR